MFRKVAKKGYLAKLVTGDRAPCAFCRRDVDDEVTFGKLYVIGDVQCHYLCALLSCCLVQKGPEEEGLFGFMYRDILAELERSKKHKCSFCGRSGANLGCSVSSCRKQFHLPCGRERNAVSLFHGSFKSFCQVHAPKQRIPDHIMCKARLRMKDSQKKIELLDNAVQTSEEGMVCVICYETVDAFPTVNTFWPPCCGKDAWFHRSCLQRMALSAGMHYIKCPLCNDKEHFYDAVMSQGYYVPDRDAAWELEQNAFAEIYERPLTCTAEACQCPKGRSHDAEQGFWNIKLCLLCGSVGAHTQCMGASETTRYICLTCTPAAPDDLQALADTIEKLIVEEQANAASNVRHGPVMPSRMSLRRTKGRLGRDMLIKPSGSRKRLVETECTSPAQSPNIQSSRLELNLTTPRKLIDSYKNDSPRKSMHTDYSPTKPIERSLNESPKSTESYKNIEPRLLSPLKHLEQGFKDKVKCMGGDAILDDRVVDILRSRFNKPRPLREKKKIINDILNGLFDNYDSNLKQKDPMREWCSPKKYCSITNKEENQTTASENGTEAAEDTVENKENSMQDTPQKKKGPDLNSSTPRKVNNTKITKDIKNDAKKVNNTQIIDDTENDVAKNQTGDDKHVNEENHHEPNNLKEIEATNDDSSNSTFHLPPEFIADTVSDDSCMTSQSPKRKTIDIKDSSLRLSKQDNSVNINLVKINDSTATDISQAPGKQMSMFRFSRLDTETLDEGVVGMDLESFKKEYLNEVDANHKCCFKHNHGSTTPPLVNSSFRTAIDFAIEAHLHNKASVDDKPGNKRKLSENSLVLRYDINKGKKRKLSENILISSTSDDDFEIKKDFKSPVKMVKNTADKVSDTIKTQIMTTKDKKRERENRKKKRDKERDQKKRPNRELKTEDRFLLDKKLESKEKRTKDSKIETAEKLEDQIKSNDETKALKSHDISLTKDLVKKREIIQKHENKTSKERIIKDRTENKCTPQFNSNDKNKIKKDKGKNLLNKKDEKLLRSNDDNKGKDLLNKTKEKAFRSNDETKEKDLLNKTKEKAFRSNDETKEKDLLNKRKEKAFLSNDETKRKDDLNKKKEKSFRFNDENKGKDLLNKKGEKQVRSNDESNEQIDKERRLQKRKHDNRINDKKRDGKDARVKHKIRSSKADEQRMQRNKLRIIDEKNVSRKEKHNKNREKYTKDRKHARNPERHLTDRQHDKNPEKYLKDRKANDDGQNIELTIDSSKGKSNKKTKTKLSISNREKNISVKIKWRKKLLRLKIESKKDKAAKVKKDNSKFKQYVLQYYSDVTSKEVLLKPEKEVNHLKRKYVKQEKTPDKLKQMSIQNFFKVKSPE